MSLKKINDTTWELEYPCADYNDTLQITVSDDGITVNSATIGWSELLLQHAPLKLYAFQPKGWGSYSFFVMAESEAKATEIVWQRIRDGQRHYRGEIDMEPLGNYYCQGLGTDYYVVTEVGPGEVVENDNS